MFLTAKNENLVGGVFLNVRGVVSCVPLLNTCP